MVRFISWLANLAYLNWKHNFWFIVHTQIKLLSSWSIFVFLVPPTLHSSSNDVTVAMENTSALLSCTFIGEPAPVITWYKNIGAGYTQVNSTSSIILANSSFSIVESNVFLRNVKRKDHGNYQCEATNDAGKSKRNMTLDVKCK